MKRNTEYESPKIELVYFDPQDVIATSALGENGGAAGDGGANIWDKEGWT